MNREEFENVQVGDTVEITYKGSKKAYMGGKAGLQAKVIKKYTKCKNFPHSDIPMFDLAWDKEDPAYNARTLERPGWFAMCFRLVEKQTIDFVECKNCEHNTNKVCDFMGLKIVGYVGEDIPCGDYI